jgi:hypothetical protein
VLLVSDCHGEPLNRAPRRIKPTGAPKLARIVWIMATRRAPEQGTTKNQVNGGAQTGTRSVLFGLWWHGEPPNTALRSSKSTGAAKRTAIHSAKPSPGSCARDWRGAERPHLPGVFCPRKVPMPSVAAKCASTAGGAEPPQSPVGVAGCAQKTAIRGSELCS